MKELVCQCEKKLKRSFLSGCVGIDSFEEDLVIN
jgi:hypothetical protein